MQLPSSYRDDAGFVFEQEGKIYRYIHPRYYNDYALLMESGLYDDLQKKGWLISHEEIADTNQFNLPEGKLLLPKQIPFICYPYEWSFDMWKDAALLTLQVATTALKKGMVLKDATPFNIQFMHGKPLFIDTLSFEKYEEGKSWVAYRQFCECFLGPLLLMHYCHPSTNKLITIYPGGIPLEVLVNLLPKRSRWNLNTYLHIHLQSRFSGNGKRKKAVEKPFSKQKLELIIKGLGSFVSKIDVKKLSSTWNDYYSNTIPGNDYLDEKTKLVLSFLKETDFKHMIDLGANDGHFSLLFSNTEKNIIAIDEDANCINALYNKIKTERITNILPMVADLSSPSPAIGWNNNERSSLTTRLKTDLVLALALVQHLAISCNLPLNMIAEWMKNMGEYLLIEFVPKTDDKLQLLLENRKDIFHDYNLARFKEIFGVHYNLLREEIVGKTGRVLFLMKRR